MLREVLGRSHFAPHVSRRMLFPAGGKCQLAIRHAVESPIGGPQLLLPGPVRRAALKETQLSLGRETPPLTLGRWLGDSAQDS